MILYHGSNLEVRQPKLLPNLRALDFGAGFYLTSDFEQANRWAKLTALRRDVGQPIVTVYNFNLENIDDLSILRFDSANIEWLELISTYRKGMTLKENYDIISGPVANDNTMPVINLYLKGSYDADDALKRLLPQKLKDQYVFKSEKAIALLTLKEVIYL